VSSTTLFLVSDLTLGSWTVDFSSPNSAPAGGWDALTNNGAGTWIEAGNGAPNPYKGTLGSLPGDFNVATACTINLTAQDSSKSGDNILAQCFKSDGSTALTSQVSVSPTNGSYTDYNLSATLLLTSKVDWTSAQLWISSDGSTDDLVATANVTLTYTPINVGPILLSTEMDVTGNSGGSGGIVTGGAAGARKVQGVRFKHVYGCTKSKCQIAPRRGIWLPLGA
jgi:hypothetical protein